MADEQLRRVMDKLMQAALRAADPKEAIRRHVQVAGDALHVDHDVFDLTQFDEVRVLAAGKAALPMAEQVVALLGARISRVVVVTKYGHAGEGEKVGRGEGEMSDPTFSLSHFLTFPSSLQVIEAGHPIPDENSRRGGEAFCDALQGCTERTLVIACVSGGASALLVAPHEGISLGMLRAINDALLRSGADIHEMNAVRSRLDRLKAGGLVRMAQPATVIGLILSDVIGDPLHVIASGLTNEPRARNVLVGNNTQSCNAVADAARDLGLVAHVVTTELRGEARVQGEAIARDLLNPSPLINDATKAKGCCLIYGGETTVTIRGEGKGGRNQELALAAARVLGEQESLRRFERLRLCIAALGTDGTDGPTDAAGAMAFSDTLQRAKNAGIDPDDFLARNDSYHFFQPLGDLIVTGPTGTNVADVVIALVIDE
jgi:hydroxypyruvate reductase